MAHTTGEQEQPSETTGCPALLAAGFVKTPLLERLSPPPSIPC
jgi:hypothetical protein